MSTLYKKRKTECVKVHNKDLVEKLIINSDDVIKTTYGTPRKRNTMQNGRPKSNPNHFIQNDDIHNCSPGHPYTPQFRSRPSSHVSQDWLNDKSVKCLQEKADPDARATKHMYTSILESENGFVKDLESVVDHKELLDRRKKEILHKKWTEQVHEPIQQQIIREMAGSIYPELEKRKRELYKEYLEHVNRKGHVFLDTIAPDEYFPLSLQPCRPTPLAFETRSLRDPLLSQERERTDEYRTILRCTTGSTYSDRDLEQIRLPPLPLVPLGRHGTECATWTSMPLTDIESPVRLASRRRMRSDANVSQFEVSMYNGEPYDPTIVDEELKTQKKRAFKLIPPFPRSYRQQMQDVPLTPNSIQTSVSQQDVFVS